MNQLFYEIALLVKAGGPVPLLDVAGMNFGEVSQCLYHQVLSSVHGWD